MQRNAKSIHPLKRNIDLPWVVLIPLSKQFKFKTPVTFSRKKLSSFPNAVCVCMRVFLCVCMCAFVRSFVRVCVRLKRSGAGPSTARAISWVPVSTGLFLFSAAASRSFGVHGNKPACACSFPRLRMLPTRRRVSGSATSDGTVRHLRPSYKS